MKLKEMKIKELFDTSHTIAERILIIILMHGKYFLRSVISSVL